MSSLIRPQCANIKSRKFQHLRCPYPATKGEFCCRHWKKPRRFESSNPYPFPTRNTVNAARKVQRWWRTHVGLRLAKERTPVFFCRDICQNTAELATMEPLADIPRDYFFVAYEPKQKMCWGFDLRSLLVYYEQHGILENPYTKLIFSPHIYDAFRRRIELLRKWKRPLHFEALSGLTSEQSWSLRVLDTCLRLDMLGYRIATQWFTDLNLSEQQRLYAMYYNLWTNDLGLTQQQQLRIVPDCLRGGDARLFKWTPGKIYKNPDLDSVRRTNLNIMERLISSAKETPDKTLGAMYTVLGLCHISPRCRRAYPWLIG